MEGKYEKLLEETKKTTQSIIHDITKEKGWELQIEKDGYKVFTKENPENGLRINRTETIVDQLDLDIFIKQVWDWRIRPQFDDHFAECQLIEDIDENTKIFYGKGKAPMAIVDPRDFVVINRIYKIENGYFLLTKSVEHEKCPIVEGQVRGEIMFAVWEVTKQDDGKIKVIIMGHNNPKGIIPKIFVNTSYKFQAESVRKTLEYYYKQKSEQQLQQQQQQQQQ